MYREFTKGNKATLQLVVPEGFREKVLRLARETMMSGHLGTKKTLDRVEAEFFWPGIYGDVARFSFREKKPLYIDNDRLCIKIPRSSCITEHRNGARSGGVGRDV